MAKKTKAAKASAGAAVTGASPYVQRLIQDEELRDNIRTAYESGRSAYRRLNNGKAPAKALLDDKKLHKDLQRAADSLRDARDALREGPKKKKRKGGIGRLLLSPSSAAAWRSASAPTCATRCSTCCSAPRRSSTTRRPPRRRARRPRSRRAAGAS